MDCLFSIILPTYNRSNYIEKAVLSVISQTFQSWELLIIDDGSDDNTSSVVQPYLTDGRIKYIYKENGGVSSARNLGIEHSSGIYISLLDSDDNYFPDFLHQTYLKYSSRPDLGFTWTGVRFVSALEKFDEVWSPNFRNKEEALKSFVIKRRIGTGYGVTIPKKVFEKVGVFDEKMKAVVDTDLFIRILRVYEAQNIPEILVEIHRHSEEKLMVPSLKRLHGYEIILEKHKDIIPVSSQAFFNFNVKIIVTYLQLKYFRMSLMHTKKVIYKSRRLKFLFVFIYHLFRNII